MYIIETDNLTKNYGKNRGICAVSLKVKKGEIFGFIGSNGAGKSTFIRTLLNLIYSTSGSAKIDGLDIVTDADKIREITAFVSAEVWQYNNLKLKDLFKFATKSFSQNKTELLDKLCKELEIDTNKLFSSLSLGNKKKVNIILALLKDSKIIVLDEPTSGLDPIMQDKIFKYLLEEKQKGKTILLSSHNLNEIQKYCDRVGIIKNGTIVKVLDTDELMAKQKHKVCYELTNGEKYEEQFEDINQIIAKLSRLKLKNCQINQVSLEDELKVYYLGE